MTQTRLRLTADARRQAVLDTACRIFSGSSYRGATTAEIAREAGISEPILYRHFGSKRDLYLACLDEAWDSFRAEAEEAVATNPLQCLGAIADAYMRGGLRLRSGAQRFYERRAAFAFPMAFSGYADVLEWFDDDAGRFRISVDVRNPRWGPLFGYRGSFEVEERAASDVPPLLKPRREERRE